MAELTYEEIRRIQAKERESALSKLPENFYEMVPSLLSSYTKEGKEKTREYENVLKILRYIYSRRQEKIVRAALSSLKGVEPPVGMLAQETDLYKTVVNVLKSDENAFNSSLSGSYKKESKKEKLSESLEREIKKIETAEKKATQKTKTAVPLHILKDVEEFVGLDGNTCGPFKSGDVVELPNKEAETLIKMKVAKLKEKS